MDSLPTIETISRRPLSSANRRYLSTLSGVSRRNVAEYWARRTTSDSGGIMWVPTGIPVSLDEIIGAAGSLGALGPFSTGSSGGLAIDDGSAGLQATSRPPANARKVA